MFIERTHACALRLYSLADGNQTGDPVQNKQTRPDIDTDL